MCELELLHSGGLEPGCQLPPGLMCLLSNLPELIKGWWDVYVDDLCGW